MIDLDRYPIHLLINEAIAEGKSVILRNGEAAEIKPYRQKSGQDLQRPYPIDGTLCRGLIPLSWSFEGISEQGAEHDIINIADDDVRPRPLNAEQLKYALENEIYLMTVRGEKVRLTCCGESSAYPFEGRVILTTLDIQLKWNDKGESDNAEDYDIVGYWPYREEIEAAGYLKHDPVNHPSHYTSHPSGIECIEITRHMGFNLGNALKYLWRNGLKDGQPAVQDLKKAVWYIQDEIKRLEKEARDEA